MNVVYALIVEIDYLDQSVQLYLYKGDAKVGEVEMPLTGDKQIGDRYTFTLTSEGRHVRDFNQS